MTSALAGIRPDQQVTVVPIRFAGDGAGEAPLTWSQADHWRANQAAGQTSTFGGSFAMSGRTLADLVEMLRFMLSRHQALRTTVRLGPDGAPRQHCVEAGVLELLVVEAGTGNPAELAEQIEQDFHHRPFELERDWPIRAAVITVDGRVSHFVLVYLHLAVDGGSTEALMADLAARDPVTGEPAGPVTAIQPLELARRQAEPAAQRQSAAAMRYLERVLRSVEPKLLGEPRRDGPARYRPIRYRSPATLLAVKRIVAEQGVPASAVLSALYSVALGQLLGRGDIWTMMLVSNRFRPGMADVVGLIVQSSPFQLDVAGVSLATAVTRARASMLLTYKNGYYDGRHRDEVLDRVQRDRGVLIDTGSYYNDRRVERPPDGLPPADDDRLRAALAESCWVPEPGRPPRNVLQVNVLDGPDAIDLHITWDPRYLELAEIQRWATGIEAVAVQAAIDPDAPTGIGRLSE
jgi:condensation domain-containing protein